MATDSTKHQSTEPLVERLTALLEAQVSALGVDLEAVEVLRAGKRSVLRLAVDKDGGIGLDEVAQVTREVSALLDSSAVMGEQAYTLEVGSRGVDRPLTLPRHWRRNVDRLVKVTPVEGAPFTGRVRSADDDRAVLEVAGRERTMAFADVRRALVQIEFKRPDPDGEE